jgi:hypothetical protein
MEGLGIWVCWIRRTGKGYRGRDERSGIGENKRVFDVEQQP